MASLKLALVFIIIVLSLQKKTLVGNIFLLAAVLMGFIFGMPVSEIPLALLHSAIAPHAISLSLLVFLLLVLSNSMQDCGHLKKMLDAVRETVHNQRLRITLFPAIIGLLPMPGGAIFSCPMVKELAKKEYTPVQMVYINYWYRHIWEYWWPLYPGMLLLAAISEVPMEDYSLTAMPLTLAAVIFGLPFLPAAEKSEKSKLDLKNILVLLVHLLPILIAIIPGFILGSFLHKQYPHIPVAREIGLGCAIIMATFLVWLTSSNGRKNIPHIIFNKHNVSMAYTAVSIMIFKGMLERSQAIKYIAEELISYDVSLTLICIILPFAAGLVTGITIGFVGTSFPIIIVLLQRILPEGTSLIPYMVLCVTSGFIGTIFSPVHLCLILTNQYFEAKQSAIYRMIWFPCLAMVLFGYLYFLILK